MKIGRSRPDGHCSFHTFHAPMMAPGGPLRQRRNGRESCGVQSHDIEGFGSLISLRQQAFSRSVHLLDFANGSRAALARSTLTLRGRGLQLGQFPRVQSSRFAEAGAAGLVWKQILARHVLICLTKRSDVYAEPICKAFKLAHGARTCRMLPWTGGCCLMSPHR